MRSLLQKVMCCLIFVFALNLSHDSALGDFPELVTQVPAAANTLLLMKSKEIAANASVLAGNNIQEFLEAARSWPVVAKWDPQRIVIAAEMDIQHMATTWEMAAVELGKKPDLGYLERRTKGVADTIMDYQIVWLDNACVLASGEKQLTFVSPLNRQSATRWLRRIKNQKSSELSSYLAEVAEGADSNEAEIILAFDLENVLGPDQVENAVKNSPLFEKVSGNPAQILSGIRGMSINCRVGARDESSINFDFSESVEPLAPIAKQLVIGAFSKMGAMLNEFNDWKFTAKGNQISMQGKLSPVGLRRILGILSIGSIASQSDIVGTDESEPDQPPVEVDPAAVDPAKPDPASELGNPEMHRMRMATQRYLSNFTKTIDDLQKNTGVVAVEQNALWINNAAKKIDQISTRNVDPEMIQFSQNVADKLRNVVYEFHQAQDEVRSHIGSVIPVFGQTEITAIPYRRTNYGGSIRYDYAPMVSQRLNLGAGRRERRYLHDMASSDATQIAKGLFVDINAETRKIRQRLSEKYNYNF